MDIILAITPGYIVFAVIALDLIKKWRENNEK